MYWNKISIAALAATVAFTAGMPGPARANLNISDQPLFLGVNVGPNVMFTLDDSGSMQWEFMPDGPQFRWTIHMFPRPNGLYGGVDYANQVPSFRDNSVHNYFGRSAANNGVFYNPDITYRPWATSTGAEMPDADPENALYNPDRPALGGLNLRAQQTQTAVWFRGNNLNEAFCDPCGGNHTYWPITYYNYRGGDPTDRDSYQRVQITSATPASTTFTSPGGITRTRDEEIQNFANWFQYSRSRVLAARNGIGRAFTELPQRARVGFGAINKGTTEIDGVNTRTVINGVRPFSGSDREGFYDLLYGRVINNFGTPLRRAAEGIGEYFLRTDARGPWSTTPGSSGGRDLACRQSFHILMSDGFWNGGNPAVGNADNASGDVHSNPEGETYQYTPVNPFKDDRSNTLGDVAMHYWKNDLRGDLANRVPTNDADPAFWQHLVTYGVGLGVRGDVNPADAFAAVESGDAIDWGNPFADNPAKIDDLLHFGLNGRGGFFSAADPDSFAEELAGLLLDIVNRTADTTGVAVSATRLTTESFIYAGAFDSADWSGRLIALDADDGTIEHDAGENLEDLGHAGRNIVTYDPANETGVDFDPSAAIVIEERLMADAPSGPQWNIANLVNYLRGDRTLEEDGTFRVRGGLLGDIVNSQPVFSGAGNEGWSRIDPGTEGYAGYIDEKKQDPRDCEPPGSCSFDRKDTVFVGANDGMLHAFDARTLDELFAYVPAVVHEKLHLLADPGYSHKFYVDGQMAVADAKLGTNWGTYLVGTFGAGGRGVYALDVTKPQDFDAGDVLWELTADDDPDIGFTYGEPVISRLEDGTWVAVFGNGYNSDDSQAYLFVVRLADGHILHKVALGSPGDNGLSGVVGWRDASTRTYLQRIYAGDLNGTVWRIDFENSVPTIVFNDGLFTDPDGRPIVATPNLAAHPGGGLVAYFGTGKLIENSDRLETEMERFYAIRDLNSAVSNNLNSNNNLSEVEISAGPESTLREVTSGEIKPNGWYMELAISSATGERVLSKPRVVFGRVVLATFEPLNDPCTPGGIQRTYVLDALSGAGALPYCPGCGATEIGIGAPFNPPVVYKPRDPGSIGDVTYPGNEDPDDPGDSDDFPDPPAVTGDEMREEWCSAFGIPPLFEGGSFMSLGTICDGRQVWRQVR